MVLVALPIDFGRVVVEVFSWCTGADRRFSVDVSATTDLTAVVTVFEHGHGFLAVPRFFVPSDSLRRRSERDGVRYVLTSW